MSFLLSFQGVFLLLTLITEIRHFLYPKGSPIAFYIQPGLGTGTRLLKMLTQIRFEERNHGARRTRPKAGLGIGYTNRHGLSLSPV